MKFCEALWFIIDPYYSMLPAMNDKYSSAWKEYIIKILQLALPEANIDVLQSKNQAMCEYCKHVSNY